LDTSNARVGGGFTEGSEREAGPRTDEVVETDVFLACKFKLLAGETGEVGLETFFGGTGLEGWDDKVFGPLTLEEVVAEVGLDVDVNPGRADGTRGFRDALVADVTLVVTVEAGGFLSSDFS